MLVTTLAAGWFALWPPDFAALGKVTDGEITVASRTLDDKQWIVAFLMDNGPVRYYHYDRPSKKATFLFSNKTDLEGWKLQKMHPVTVKSRDGQTLKVKTPDNVAVRGVAKASLSDVKQNSFIGVTGMPQADGSQKAVEIHIFPEALRGTGEGHRPWDLMPNSTMTNAAVAQMVKGVHGDEITLKYKDGDKKVVVVPETVIVAFVPGDKSELKPGAKIFIGAANKKEDGTLEAAAINVGRDGITPPM